MLVCLVLDKGAEEILLLLEYSLSIKRSCR